MGWNYFGVTAIDSNQVETELSNIDSVFVTWTAIDPYCFEVSIPKIAVSINPNPVSNTLNVTVNSEKIGYINIELFDITVRIILKTEPIHFPIGGITSGLDVSGLPSGAYTVRIYGDCPELTHTLVILQ